MIVAFGSILLLGAIGFVVAQVSWRNERKKQLAKAAGGTPPRSAPQSSAR